MPAWYVRSAAIASSIPISTFCPRRVFVRASSASVTPCAADMPATRSAIDVPIFTGGPSGKPVMSINPLSACTTRSYPARPPSGPDSPKPETPQYTSFLFSVPSVAYPSPSFSIVPGRKFSRTTSLILTRAVKIFRAAGAFRFRVMLFLLRLTDMKYVVSPEMNGGQLRVSSPLPGSSILITSAPMSARIMEQNGPARTRVRSRTRMPESGLMSRTGPSFQRALGEAARDRVYPVARSPRAPPEDARTIQCTQVREIVHVVDRLDSDRRADLEALRLGAVADEARAVLELHQRDVQRRAESFGRRMQRGEGDDFADAGQRDGNHRHRVPRTERGRRRDDKRAPRTS